MMIKLIFIAVFITGALALTEEQQQLMNDLHSSCVGQTGVSEDVITKARGGDIADDPALKCFIKCVFDEIGIITDDEKIDVEGALAVLPDEMKEYAPPIMNKCATQPGSDLCDSMFQTLKCYYNLDSRMFFLP